MSHILKIETAGIQKYIFSSNKLKVNLGASYIIEHMLYKDLLRSCLDDKNFQEQIDNWFQDKPDAIILKGSEGFRVGYIGGGNAVLYGEEVKLKQIERTFKLKVLEQFPGLEVYTGIISKSDNYSENNRVVTEEVNKNRTLRPFINKTLNHGFFNSCPISGDVAECHWKAEDKWVSSEVFSKIQFCEGTHEANKKHELDLLTPDQRELFTFPLDFEDFSTKDDKAYIAIVHIDGNNFGNTFIGAHELDITQKLSLNVRSIGTDALKATINEGIIGKITEKESSEGIKILKGQEEAIKDKITVNRSYKFSIGDLDFKLTRDKKNRVRGIENYKLHLPIRPIITGGDDITFVCEGTLGVPLAKLFLEKFTEIGNERKIIPDGVFACAGVAIIKQKYPFYKGYQLSEELIKKAKETSRSLNGNFLSYIVAGYGTGTSLKDLKDRYAKADLYQNTYALAENQNNSIEKLEALISLFNKSSNGKAKVPRNKLIEVRNALVNGNIEQVWEVVKSRLALEKCEWDPITQKALTFDAIELVDFYNKAHLKLDNDE